WRTPCATGTSWPCCSKLRETILRGPVRRAGAGRHPSRSLSVLALDAQQARQAVALLLRPAAREQVVQIAVAALFRSPDLAEVLDDLAHVGLDHVLLVMAAQEADDLPVLAVQFQTLVGGLGTDEILRPVGQIHQ